MKSRGAAAFALAIAGAASLATGVATGQQTAAPRADANNAAATVADAREPSNAAMAPTTMPQEIPGSAPSPAHVWVAGYYGWNGSAYVWIHGTWQIPPSRWYRRWDPPHWEMHHGLLWRRGQEYRYVPGRWVR